MPERKEALMRIVVGIVSGIVLYAWYFVVVVIAVIHWFYVIFKDKRNKDLSEFCNLWVTQAYSFLRYMTFTTNSRPFPFSSLVKVLHPVELKEKK